MGNMAGIMSTNTHLNGILGFKGVFDIGFIFILEM